jgi:hypothetical protein
MVPREPPYPPPPRHAPPELGRRLGPPAAVRAVGIAGHLLGIALFALSPVAFAVGGWTFLTANDSSIIVRAGGFVVCTGLAFLTLKSLLPRRLPLGPGLVTVGVDEQPMAHAFLSRVAAELGVAAANRLYVGSGTELRLAGSRSLVDLFRAPRWELHVGLWLWQGLSLSEFQALIARTLAPAGGRRIEQFRSLLEAMTWGTDTLDQAGRTDAAMAGLFRAIGAAHQAVLFPVRGLARLLLRIDPAGDSTLVDDLAAVRIAGSDALVHAILRSDFAGAALTRADELLGHAADDGVWTADYYEHVADAARLVREAHNDFTLGTVPMLRGSTAGKYTDVFEPGAAYLSRMWAGNPAPDVREQNAKRDFVSAERDERPAAELLENAGPLRERLTILRYAEVLEFAGDVLPLPPMTVRRWLALQTESPFPDKYAGSYGDGRQVEPGTYLERQDALSGEPWDDARLISTANSLYVHAAERAATWRESRKRLDRLLARTLYHPTGRQLAFAEDLEDDVRKAGRWLAALDRWAYVIHVLMAARLPTLARHDTLLGRYDSVIRFQRIPHDARRCRMRVAAFLDRLADADRAASYRLAREAGREFIASRTDFGALLSDAAAIDDPLLREWTGDVALDEFLYSHADRPPTRPRATPRSGERLLGAWVELERKAQWLHRLGVGRLLEFHEQIEREFAAQIESGVRERPWFLDSAPAAEPSELPGMETIPPDVPAAEIVDETATPDEPLPPSSQWYDDWGDVS